MPVFLGKRLSVAVAVALIACAALPAPGRAADGVSPAALKAAFLFNFAKFTDWGAVQPGAAIVLCVANDDQVVASLTDSARGQSVSGRAVEVRQVKADLAGCHLLFVPGSDARQMLGRVVKEQPLLTVSDANGFAQAGGMIELFQDAGRMRFAVNVETAQRSGIRLSSRLLDLAKIVRSAHAQ